MTIYAHHRLRFFRRSCEPVVVLTGEIEYRLVGSDDFPWDTHPMTEHAAVYRQRFAEGGEALIGSTSGEIVFSAWVQRMAVRIDEIAWLWRLPDLSATVYDVATMPAWRGRGVYPEALRRCSGLLADEGVRYLWIYAEEDNAASLRGIEKALFEYRGSVEAHRLFGYAFRRGVVEGVNT